MKHHDYNQWPAIAAGALLALAAGTAGADAPATEPTAAAQAAQAERSHRHGPPGKGVTHRRDHKSAEDRSVSRPDKDARHGTPGKHRRHPAQAGDATPTGEQKQRRRRSGPPGKFPYRR